MRDSSTSRTMLAILVAAVLVAASFAIPKASAQSTMQLTIASVYADGAAGPAMWATVRLNGALVASGFTPLTASVTPGTAYAISAADYQDITLHHWADTGTFARPRTVTVNSATTFTAVYVSNAHPLPSAPSGTSELTVNTQYANGNPLTGMYTTLRQGGATGAIVDTGFSPATFTVNTGTQYTVTTSDYQLNTFYQWDNGSTTRARSLTVNANTAITSLYVSPSNPAPGSGPTASPVSASVAENSKTGVSISLQGSGLGTLSYHVVAKPAKGTVSMPNGNTVVYTPYDWQDGADSFTYAVFDGTTSSSPATVSINISNTGSKSTSRLVVISLWEDEVSRTGLSTTLSQGGTTINSGFTHIHYSLNNGQGYTVSVSGDSGRFARWDNGSTSTSRPVNISQDTPVYAYYRR